MTKTYVTTYCNHAHNVKTGKPVGHECYTLPRKALELEIDGKYPEAIAILEDWSRNGRPSPRLRAIPWP